MYALDDKSFSDGAIWCNCVCVTEELIFSVYTTVLQSNIKPYILIVVFQGRPVFDLLNTVQSTYRKGGGGIFFALANTVHCTHSLCSSSF